jgi:ABC-type branched-subunit amino acid transport system substrate-binding protein
MKKYLVLLLLAVILAVPVGSGAAPLYQGEDYVVQADDWLSKLSEKFLGDVLAYPAITYYTNQKNAEDESYAKISSSDEIEVGWKIYIPTQEEAQAYFEGGAETVGEGAIKIGAVVPLSAPGSVTGGEAMKAAFEIALEEINAEGGVLGQQVELVVADTEGLPERGAAQMERLINQEGVVGVVGEYHSAVALAEMEVANANNVPVIFAETWSDSITEAQYPQIFRIAPLSSLTAETFAGFMESIGVQKAVLMTENTSYGIEQAEVLAELAAERGIETVTFSADIGTQDFSGIIERIKAEEPDLIFVSVTGEASYNFEQQAAEAGIGPQDLPMLCNQIAGDSEAFWANVPDGNLCIYSRIGLPKPLYTEETIAFIEKYTAKTGKAEAESYAMEAYDSLKLMAQAIDAAGATDGDSVIAALEDISYEGALGTVTFPYGTDNPVPEDMPAKWWHQFPDPAITLVQYQEVGQDVGDAPVVYPETYRTADPILAGR